MMWILDKNVEAARKAAGWCEFHRACGRVRLYYDHIERHDKQYAAVAYTLDDARRPVKLADGRGATVLLALAAAYRDCGRTVTEAEPWLEMLLNPSRTAAAVVPDDDDFDSLIDDDDFEGLLA